MSKDGRIGNRALLKRLANELQMEGVNRMPSDLNRDQVQVVVDLGRWVEPQLIAPASEITVDFDSATRAINGLVTDDWEVMPAIATHHSWMQSLDLVFSIPIDAASDPIAIRGYLQLPVGQPFPVTNIQEATRSNSGMAVSPRWNLRGSHIGFASSGNPMNAFASTWDGFIAATIPFRVDIAKPLVFPAASTVTWRRLVWRWPINTARPF